AKPQITSPLCLVEVRPHHAAPRPPARSHLESRSPLAKTANRRVRNGACRFAEKPRYSLGFSLFSGKYVPDSLLGEFVEKPLRSGGFLH
ncbi:MAG TPA: hypothetical protein VJ723_06395, partial [Candidatus Angelobacter sp.]|nr:hypothetical protein [Candidatus Angelobacter sp.]